ncbi:MAG: DUF1700 domain-containing protein [Defluviitaleaceae bacterium]|nr:DUF1700 domain-containing protein [Defluviitaleaceae bacterium]
MTRKDFLRKLRFALWGGFTCNERRDVISDYEGFFVQGQSEGISESSIAEGLGDPTAIAFNLANESGKWMPIGALILKYLTQIYFAFGGIIFFGTALVYYNMNADVTLVIAGILCVCLMSVSLFFALKMKMTVPNFRKGFKGLLFTNLTILILAAFCIIFFNSRASMDFAFWVFENFQSQRLRLTTGLLEIRMICFLIAAFIGIWGIVGTWKGKTERFISAVHAVGFCVYLETVYKLWQSLNDIELYWRPAARASLVYVISIIITIISVFVLKAYGKGAVANGK